MSQVKFQEQETIRTTQQYGGNGGNGGGPPGPPPRSRGGPQGPSQGPQQKEGFAHEVGDALTKGAGPSGYLAVSRAGQYATACHFVLTSKE